MKRKGLYLFPLALFIVGVGFAIAMIPEGALDLSKHFFSGKVSASTPEGGGLTLLFDVPFRVGAFLLNAGIVVLAVIKLVLLFVLWQIPTALAFGLVTGRLYFKNDPNQ